MSISPHALLALALAAAVALSAVSGVPALLLDRQSQGGQKLAAACSILAGVLGLGAAGIGLATPATTLLDLRWGFATGRLTFALDPLTAAFLVPIFAVSSLGAIYGLGYWSQREHPEDGAKLRFFYGLLTASMALVTLAREGCAFLFAWELMALSAFFLTTTEDRERAVQKAGWIYLVCTHVGTLLLFVMVTLLRKRTGSFAWLPGANRGGLDSAIFLFALLGFGFKAGMAPLHFWLPAAHANAPSHVSAMMSGVMLKVGIYGILRVTSLLGQPPSWWGSLVLVLGTVTAVLGIALASGQGDIKRLLAYSSIENIGIVLMAVGMALLGRAHARPEWIMLGIVAAVLHVWNHAAFKSLLFFGAGAVVHATGTREMDRMGGLLRRMPWTAGVFFVGALAVTGLPPLNGFMSELLVYIGLLSMWTGPHGLALAPVSVVALSLVGALAVASFVKLLGIVFLGTPRSEAATHAHEPPRSMLGPMIALAVTCVVLAGSAPLLARALEPVAASWAGLPRDAFPRVAELAPLGWAALMSLALIALLGLVALLARRLVAKRTVTEAGTWGCGYAAPTSRMQYTGRSFGEWISERFLPQRLAPKLEVKAGGGLFPSGASFASDAADPLESRIYEPAIGWLATRLFRLRKLQTGHINVYLIYVLVTLLSLFAWTALTSWWNAPSEPGPGIFGA